MLVGTGNIHVSSTNTTYGLVGNIVGALSSDATFVYVGSDVWYLANKNGYLA